MKLSLACITGNAEKYINRFLDSFQPYFDEVVIVRAVGSLSADETLNIAESRGCKTSEYFNGKSYPVSLPGQDFMAIEPGTSEEWPHVDDFAAARNQAFDIATGDWIMWADMDDVLEGGEHIRSDLESMPEEALALSVPYDVRDDQLRVMRERIIRKGETRWVNPVHEQLDFPNGVKCCETNRWQVIHMPLGKRGKNDERNLRILESIANPTGSQRFHSVMSLRAVGRIKDAQNLAAQIIVERPEDVGKAEIYELLFMLAQLTQDHEMRARLMNQALLTDPTRREAYGDLAMSYIVAGESKGAVALATAMESLRLPDPLPWNIRRKYYGYAGKHILGSALRFDGRLHEADALETNHVIRNGAKISLLHATRGRPAQAAATRRKWLETASLPDSIEHIYALDIDDDATPILAINRHVLCIGNGGPVAAWNAAASEAKGEILVQISDDFEPFQGWDVAILNAIGDTSKPAVLAVSDGHRKDDLLCMAILTRARYKQQGSLFHPEFFSMFSDNWFSECAFSDSVVIDARDRITFEHLHPAFGKAEMDETYARSNAAINYTFGKGVYDRLKAGVKVSADVDGWCDYRDLYSMAAQLLPDGAKIVEIGSWQGQSVIHLCQRLQDIGKSSVVHCVDTFKGEENQSAHIKIVAAHGGSIFGKFNDNIISAGIRDMIRVIVGDSAESADNFQDESLDFVFIDAAHDYDSVVKDLAAWYPKVKTGGIIAGHDYPWHEVRKAVDEHASAHGWKVIAHGRCWIRINEVKL